MTSRDRNSTDHKPCAVKGCQNERVPGESWCLECRRKKKAAARQAREKQGHFERHDEESTLMQLLAFPEPAKFLAHIQATCRPHVDRRTIAFKQRKHAHRAVDFELEDTDDDR